MWINFERFLNPVTLEPFLQHIALKDGLTDPEGIKLRAVEGQHGCDYLGDSKFDKAKSYVMAHIVQALAGCGYDPGNLCAMTWDWRLPPFYLEVRDKYFTRLKMKVEQLYEQNNHTRVVLMAHSLGTKLTQYFLQWAEQNITPNGKEWIQTYVHAALLLGGPTLGSSKALRSVVLGDSMDIPTLSLEAGRQLSNGCASVPWMHPLLVDSLYPMEVAKVFKDGRYQKMDTGEVLEEFADKNAAFFESYFKRDPLLFDGTDRNDPKMPQCQPPPVENLWFVYGVNENTEISACYKVNGKRAERGHASAEEGFVAKEGFVYETKSTYQQFVKSTKSGDGTVPYCSLAYHKIW
eukprot:CAMPEP_0201517742 /NCGR_PEP_ID=MMETSP0161_2-20130828/8786_1 /ASSEMBLY_ACC=CAM_ASM_000251 /TAXON_ID=180227 /ORGANISM="Neoparamoeba aestuarina, Strain SoJaBio B1-5/56/2" /LENGTH=348 /DNA_ID=CAMNT_0047915347 /DNA_START=964 /DNA_END=2007 /DNA_ORIENTATION=+